MDTKLYENMQAMLKDLELPELHESLLGVMIYHLQLLEKNLDQRLSLLEQQQLQQSLQSPETQFEPSSPSGSGDAPTAYDARNLSLERSRMEILTQLELQANAAGFKSTRYIKQGSLVLEVLMPLSIPTSTPSSPTRSGGTQEEAGETGLQRPDAEPRRLVISDQYGIEHTVW